MTRANDYWLNLPPKRRAILRYSLPLLLLAVLVALDWMRLNSDGVTSTRSALRLLKTVGYTCAVCVFVLLIGVRRWPLQMLGLVSLLFGLAGLFIRFLGGIGPQPVGEHERDLIQASLDVGSWVLLAGVIVWAIGRSFGRGGPSPLNGNVDSPDADWPESERRTTIRREADRKELV